MSIANGPRVIRAADLPLLSEWHEVAYIGWPGPQRPARDHLDIGFANEGFVWWLDVDETLAQIKAGDLPCPHGTMVVRWPAVRVELGPIDRRPGVQFWPAELGEVRP